MIYKLICAALLVSSGEALKVSTGVSRRAAIAKAASIALPLAGASPAFAALQRAADADIYKRADEGKLSAIRAIERAEQNDLVDGSSATCDELDKLIAVDRETDLVFESLKQLELLDPDEKKAAKTTSETIKTQIMRLKAKKKERGCATSDILDTDAILERSRTDTLQSEAVISRAKQGEFFVDKADQFKTNCKDLADILRVDDKAMIKINEQTKVLQAKANKLKAEGKEEEAKKAQIQVVENKLILKRISGTETAITSKQLQKMCTY